MSNDGNSSSEANAKPNFTERELQMLAWAMMSLKSGPPDIDYEKLAGFAGMSNSRSASNAWGKIKAKLPTAGGSTPSTPKRSVQRKKTVKGDNDDDDAATPKSGRKRAAKKQDVNGESSPTKKTARGKKPSDDKPVDTTKAEAGDSEGPSKSDESETKSYDSTDDLFKMDDSNDFQAIVPSPIEGVFDFEL